MKVVLVQLVAFSGLSWQAARATSVHKHDAMAVEADGTITRVVRRDGGTTGKIPAWATSKECACLMPAEANKCDSTWAYVGFEWNIYRGICMRYENLREAWADRTALNGSYVNKGHDDKWCYVDKAKCPQAPVGKEGKCNWNGYVTEAQCNPLTPEAERNVQVIGAQFLMLPGSLLVSGNSKFYFSFDEAGELAVTQRENGEEKKLWSAKTGGKGGTKLVLQGEDQLLVLYGPNGKVWSTGVSEKGGCATRLVMENDGNLVQYNSLDQPIWNTRTGGAQVSPHQGSGQSVMHDPCRASASPKWSVPKLGENMVLLPGGQLVEQEGGGFVAQLQEDGNFVVRETNGRVLWASGSHAAGDFNLALQGDQHLVLNGPAGPVWYTGVRDRDEATSPVRLVMQEDGNLCEYDAEKKPLWCTSTFGPRESPVQGGGLRLM